MSEQDQSSQQHRFNKQPQQNLRNVVLDKNVNEKKKKTLGWDRIRENVGEFTHDGVIHDSPTSSTTSSPSSSRSNTPKPQHPPTNSKKTHLNPFMRSQPSSTFDVDGRPTLANTTLVAAQAAGMTNFTRNFRQAGHKNGVIYATSTAVQQDIYRLERDLDKLLVQLENQNTNLADSVSSFETHNPIQPLPGNQFHSTNGKRSVFQRQSVADLFNNNSTSTTNMDSTVEQVNNRKEASRVSSIMSSVLESIIKHKAATRLPLTGEILALLAVPFDKSPMIGKTRILLAVIHS